MDVQRRRGIPFAMLTTVLLTRGGFWGAGQELCFPLLSTHHDNVRISQTLVSLTSPPMNPSLYLVLLSITLFWWLVPLIPGCPGAAHVTSLFVHTIPFFSKVRNPLLHPPLHYHIFRFQASSAVKFLAAPCVYIPRAVDARFQTL